MQPEQAMRPVVPQAEHFGDEASRQDAAHLGMWVFLSTEVLLFAGLFAAYAMYRLAYPEVFHQAREHMAVALGTINTYLLVTSSVLVALAISSIRSGRDLLAAALLAGAVLLGCGFLVVKGIEYAQHVREGALPGAHYALDKFAVPGASLYFTLYWIMTAVHAVHVTIGVGVLSVLCFQTLSGKFSASYHTPLELGGMYWHLVDVVWLFLWPLLYLT
jgi:cytochrome c oxidase subunit 3